MWRLFVRGLALFAALSAGACGNGGMDGAGAAVEPACLADLPGVSIQPLWSGGQLHYLIVNERSSAIELRAECAPPEACAWSVPAHATRLVEQPIDSSSQNAANSGQVLWLADGTGRARLQGQAALAGPAGVFISNSKDSSGVCPNAEAQIETAFVARPGRTFSLTISVSTFGTLIVPKRGAKAGDFQRVDALAVRSARAEVQSDDENFIVTLPASVSRQDPVRVEVDVAVPELAERDLAVGFTATLNVPSPWPVFRIFPLSE